MKYIGLSLLTLLVLVLITCDGWHLNGSNYFREPDKNPSYDYSIGTKIIFMDSCEYIKLYRGDIIHRGNCRYCAERRKSELKELLEQLK